MSAANTATVYIKTEVDGKQGVKATRQLGEEAKKAGDKGKKAFNGTNDSLGKYKKTADSAIGVTSRLGGAFAGLTAGSALGGFVSLLDDGVMSLAEYERLGLRTVALIRATANAAGLGAYELKNFADQLDLDTLGDRDEIIAGINALQTFRSVQGEIFTRAIEDAGDLAEVFGGDLRSQVVQLGKALEDPITGLTSLRRVGVSFTEQQQSQIKALVASNEKLEAQRIILDEIENQVGGAARGAAGGMLGKLDTMNFQWRAFKENLSDTVAASNLASAAINTLTGALKHLNKFIAPDVAGMIEKEIAGLESRIKIYERLGGSGGAALEKIIARIATLRASLEELRDPVNDLSADYGKWDDGLEDTTISVKDAAKAAKELEKQIAALDDAVRQSNANPWDPIGFDLDSGGIDEVAAAIQKLEIERNNQRLETARNIAKNMGVEDTYDLDMGDWSDGLEDEFEYMVELSERTANAMQENFSDFFFDAMTGKLEDLGDYLNAFTRTVQRAMADIAGQQLAQGLFGKEYKGDGWLSSLALSLSTAAHGDVFSGPGIAAHENTIVKQPTIVPLAKGAALIGEAGDEAVMPLGRTPQGDLGVKVADGDRRPPIEVVINPVNESGMGLAVEPRIMQRSPDKLVADMVIKRKMTTRNMRRRM